MDSFLDDGKVLPNWWHSSWRECAEWAKRVSAKKLALFHYGFALSDDDIYTMEENAQKEFPNAFTSADYMRVSINMP